MTTIQAGLTYYKQVNEKVREAAEKDDNITIENVIGQRYIGCGSSGKTITVYGTPATASASTSTAPSSRCSATRRKPSATR